MFDTGKNLSLRARESPVFCISIVTAMPPVLYKVTSNYFLSKPGKASQMAPSRVLFGTVLRKFLLESG